MKRAFLFLFLAGTVWAGDAARFTNSLGLVFVPIPGTHVQFSIWDTRVRDYGAFAKDTQREWTPPEFKQSQMDPAVNLSWTDARDFCAWLSGKEHKHYRLPTDEEWSLAAGLTNEVGATPSEKHRKIPRLYSWGEAWPPPTNSGNFADETLSAKKKDAYRVIEGYNDGYADTSPVGKFAPNRNGLYDMGGNVWQWCDDWYDASHHDRVMRGGSCTCVPRMLLLSWRNAFGPSNTYSYLGFRCVLADAP